MKHVYNATRPAWASLHAIEPYLVALAGVLIVALSPTGRKAYDELLGISPNAAVAVSGDSPEVATAVSEHQALPRRNHTNKADLGWAVLEVLGPIGCWFGFIWVYRRLRVGCYPSAFVYCFYVPERSNTSHCRRVVGYLELSAERHEGEIIVEGTSMDWDGYPVANTDASYTSTHAYGTKKSSETMCNIRFGIDEEDRDKRNFERGLLQFQLVRPVDPSRRVDQYAGYMRSARLNCNDPEIDIAVRCKGYAEKLNSPVNGPIEDTLEIQGAHLFGELDILLSQETRPPRLWKCADKDKLKFDLTNSFGLIIPSPQSVLLDGRVATFIDAALNKMLMRPGIAQSAVDNFKKTARRLARQDEEFPVKNFEDDVKDALSKRFERALPHPEPMQQAKAMYERIRNYTDGNPLLLDVGCGNGSISDLLKTCFPGFQHLPFAQYREGHALPGVEKKYDTVLLLNVLHHSSDPEHLFDAAWETTVRKLIIIEPVVGVREGSLGLESESAKLFAKLEQTQQVAYASFVDWFCSRILRGHTRLGYNFATSEKWESIFRAKNAAFVHRGYVCQDIELEPMPHAMYVLDKEKSVNRETSEKAA